jgi:hypothetical protein
LVFDDPAQPCAERAVPPKLFDAYKCPAISVLDLIFGIVWVAHDMQRPLHAFTVMPADQLTECVTIAALG